VNAIWTPPKRRRSGRGVEVVATSIAFAVLVNVAVIWGLPLALAAIDQARPGTVIELMFAEYALQIGIYIGFAFGLAEVALLAAHTAVFGRKERSRGLAREIRTVVVAIIGGVALALRVDARRHTLEAQLVFVLTPGLVGVLLTRYAWIAVGDKYLSRPAKPFDRWAQ
jgi:purine-cytosine permease-like protein